MMNWFLMCRAQFVIAQRARPYLLILLKIHQAIDLAYVVSQLNTLSMDAQVLFPANLY